MRSKLSKRKMSQQAMQKNNINVYNSILNMLKVKKKLNVLSVNYIFILFLDKIRSL